MAVITIDYTPAVHQTAGIGRLTRECVRRVVQLGTSHAFKLFCMGASGSEFARAIAVERPVATRATPISDRWFHRIWFRAGIPLPVELFAGRSDLYHATDFILPPTRAAHKLLTVHDLTFERDPDSAAPTLLRFLKKTVPASARKADHIIADSEATAADLAALYAIPRERITVILSGVDGRFRAQAETSTEDSLIRGKYGIGNDPFVLAVGTMQRRKNHLGLVRAFAALPARRVSLVISGGAGWLYDDVRAEVEKLRIADRVKFIGFADEADLPALYRTASVFAFPSFYEGFGIPPLEAMASGTPVVTSNVSSLPEVVGDVALTVNPHDTAALSAALERALSDVAWRRSAIPAGIARARTFTWDRAAGQLLGVYERLLGE